MKFLVLLGFLVAVATSYKTGAPTGACLDMTPKHGVSPQTVPSPYQIMLSQQLIRPRARVNVTLMAMPGDDFAGFFMQARAGNTPIGRFEPGNGVKLVSCGSANTSVTHNSPADKTMMTVTWVAPDICVDKVVFTVTTVRSVAVFWVGQKSKPLSVMS